MKYILKKSRRKTISIEVTRECEVIVRAPDRVSKRTVNKVICENKEWIEKQLKKQREKGTLPTLTETEIASLKEKAKELLPERVRYYSKIMGVSPTQVKITSAQKRLGSCSNKGRICFSYRLMQYPEEAVDYVVVHELAHLKHMNHSPEFYMFIESFMPDYKERKKLLK